MKAVDLVAKVIDEHFKCGLLTAKLQAYASCPPGIDPEEELTEELEEFYYKEFIKVMQRLGLAPADGGAH